MKDFHAFCKSQILRFAGRLGWVDPKENPAPARDLIEALERFKSQDLAKRIVDALVEASQYCPTVPDIVRVGQGFREREGLERKVGCEKCGFTGWISVTKNGYDFSAPCECRSKPPAPAAAKPIPPRTMTPVADVRMRAAGDE